MTQQSQPTQWYSDPDLLVQELAGERRDRIGTPSIPGYDEIVELNRGGQGVVFSARQLSTGRTVAIKVLLGGTYASSSAHARFQREVSLVSKLRHPNIVHVYDSGLTPDGCPYLTMEYIEGVPLDKWLPDHVTPRQRLANRTVSADIATMMELFAKIGDAVQYAHQRGIIHRDLKPGNILVDERGEPHVLDFGVAKASSEMDGQSLSVTGEFVGSLPWASPEQVADRNTPPDVRSDVYALGVMLYQMLTGRFPYDVSTSVAKVIDGILHADLEKPSSLVAGLNDEIDTIVLKCLSKEADRRYQSVAALTEDVRRFLAGEPIQAKRDSAWYQMRKLAGRYRSFVTFMSIALVLTIVFSIFMTVSYTKAKTAEALAAQRLIESEQANERATREMEKAVSVNEFLEKMLTSSDPTVLDRDITVRETLENAVAQIDNTLDAHPEVEASLRSSIGWTYYNLGQGEKAAEQLSKASDLFEQHAGVEAEDTLAAKHRLAQALATLDRMTEAGELYKHVLETSERALGPDAWMTLAAMSTYANWLMRTGELSHAKAMHEKMIAHGEQSLGPDHPEVLVARNQLALILLDLGMFKEAERTYNDLIEIRGARGERAAVLILKHNLAAAYRYQGKYDLVVDILLSNVAECEEVFGPDHPHTLSNLYSLASVYTDVEKLSEAERIARDLVSRYMNLYGDEHEDTLHTRNQLAVIYMSQEKWSEAEQTLREVLSGYLARKDQAVSPVIYQNLGAALSHQGKYQEATELVITGLKLSDDRYGRSSPYRIGILNELGRARLLADDTEGALQCFTDAHQLAEELFAPGHPYILVMKIGMGKALIKLGKYEQAEKLLTASYNGFAEKFGPDYSEAKKSATYLAEIAELTGDADMQAVWKERAQSPE